MTFTLHFELCEWHFFLCNIKTLKAEDNYSVTSRLLLYELQRIMGRRLPWGRRPNHFKCTEIPQTTCSSDCEWELKTVVNAATTPMRNKLFLTQLCWLYCNGKRAPIKRFHAIQTGRVEDSVRGRNIVPAYGVDRSIVGMRLLLVLGVCTDLDRWTRSHSNFTSEYSKPSVICKTKGTDDASRNSTSIKPCSGRRYARWIASPHKLDSIHKLI